jgi:hypothetical protein
MLGQANQHCPKLWHSLYEAALSFLAGVGVRAITEWWKLHGDS